MLLIVIIIVFKSLLLLENSLKVLVVKALVLVSLISQLIAIEIDTAGTGLVYVSEDGNHHVSVFTSDDIFFRNLVGSYGSNI